MTTEIDAWCGELAANQNHCPPPDHEFTVETELIDYFNLVIAIVETGDQVRIATFDKTGRPQFLRVADATLLYKPFKYAWEDENGTVKSKDALKVWMESHLRRQYGAVVFKPQGAAAGELNLFTGFAIQPRVGGSWNLLWNHILGNVCQGNEEHARWLIAWIAQLIQEPGVKPGTAIALKGEMGMGKSVLSDVLGVLIGDRYAPALDQSDQITGRFNGPMEETLLARVEEGFFAGDPKARSSIKHLITSRTLQYERKNLNAYQAPNYTRVILTTNEPWAVAAGPEERRWFVLEVGNAQRQNRAYFGALIAELEAGGYEALMHDLMHMDISDVDLRNPPKTDALVEQIIQGFSPEQGWWMTVLDEGTFPSLSSNLRVYSWHGEKDNEVQKDKVAESYREYVTGFRGRIVTDHQIGAFLSKTVPNLRHTRPTVSGQRKRFYVFPPLAELRAAFMKATGYAFVLDEDEPKVGLHVVGGTDAPATSQRPRSRF